MEQFDETDLNHILEAVVDYKVRLMRMEVNPAGGGDLRKSQIAVLSAIEAKVLRALEAEEVSR